ncbi:uncharacterized protein TNCV_976451 [Trichonephila clavipes]|nr:uncharacterized protein TNCV_976451 [Trichonephila clavipes]
MEIRTSSPIAIVHAINQVILKAYNGDQMSRSMKKTQNRGNSDASTSGCNFRPRRGAKVESRPTNEKRTQQGGLVRVGGSREQQYSPYIEEQARSAGRMTRSRNGQQQYCQERKGETNMGRSQSLEVLVGYISYRK